MKIEELTVEKLSAAPDEEVFSLRARCVQLWKKAFQYETGSDVNIDKMDRSFLLDKYSMVLNEMANRGLIRKMRYDIDHKLARRKMFGGLDPSEYDSVDTGMKVSISGDFVRNPKKADSFTLHVPKEVQKCDSIGNITKSVSNQLSNLECYADKELPKDLSLPVYKVMLVPVKELLVEEPKKKEEEEVEKKEVAFNIDIMKVDQEEQIVGGIVYEPDKADSQGDWADSETIRKGMINYMLGGQDVKIMHEGHPIEAKVVESFQPEEDTKRGGKKVKKGSWWMSVKVFDEEAWKEVKEGNLAGFSMGGKALVQGNE